MTKDIVGKLQLHLGKPIDTECGVVYLLAEVRKLLERDDRQRRSGCLWMYCHWALHVDLDGPKTTLEFLKQVDLWVTNTVHGLLPRGPWKPLQEHYLFRDFVYLDAFRRELRRFLVSYMLPTNLCDEDPRWFAFLSAYAGVIEDGSLAISADKNNDIGAVKQITFTKGRTLSAEHHVGFVIQWNIELKDGRTLKTEVDALPADKITSHHLELVPPKVAVSVP